MEQPDIRSFKNLPKLLDSVAKFGEPLVSVETQETFVSS